MVDCVLLSSYFLYFRLLNEGGFSKFGCDLNQLFLIFLEKFLEFLVIVSLMMFDGNEKVYSPCKHNAHVTQLDECVCRASVGRDHHEFLLHENFTIFAVLFLFSRQD